VDSRRLELGLVVDLSAESFGVPGQRTFRLLVRSGEGQVAMWLEKEQVVMLGSAIGEMLDRLAADSGTAPVAETIGTFVGELDVKVGSLEIGYDPAHAGFSVEATDFESPMGLTSIALLAAREQLERVQNQIDSILSASRPRCLVCGRPLTGSPHFCPESNGHSSPTVAE
jgi:uncharacterized repeat protein (TIGR03847 family)